MYRKKLMVKIIIGFLVFQYTAMLSVTAFGFGREDVGTASMEFLRIGVGARPAAMGEVFGVVGDDASTIFWNPAGLGRLRSHELSGMHLKWFENFNYHSLSYVNPLNHGALAGGLVYLHKDDIEKTSAAVGGRYSKDGNCSFNNGVLIFGYGRSINRSLDAGCSLKIIQDEIDNENTNAIAIDSGILYKLYNFDLGVSLQNLGTKVKGFNLPLIIRTGGSYKLLNDNLMLALQINVPMAGRSGVNLGGEYWMMNILALRAGYKYKEGGNQLVGLTGLTCGMGFKLNGCQVDYAFVPYGDLGQTHRFSLSMKWGMKEEIKSEKLKVKSEEKAREEIKKEELEVEKQEVKAASISEKDDRRIEKIISEPIVAEIVVEITKKEEIENRMMEVEKIEIKAESVSEKEDRLVEKVIPVPIVSEMSVEISKTDEKKEEIKSEKLKVKSEEKAREEIKKEELEVEKQEVKAESVSEKEDRLVEKVISVPIVSEMSVEISKTEEEKEEIKSEKLKVKSEEKAREKIKKEELEVKSVKEDKLVTKEKSKKKITEAPEKEIIQAKMKQKKIIYGDTLSEIAEQHYGSWRLYKSLAECNNIYNPDLIIASNEISLPIVYIVVKGDTLWRIADHYLGNPYLYKRIAKDNKIANPDLIYPKQRLLIRNAK